jgi:hypothetical protein
LTNDDFASGAFWIKEPELLMRTKDESNAVVEYLSAGVQAGVLPDDNAFGAAGLVAIGVLPGGGRDG